MNGRLPNSIARWLDVRLGPDEYLAWSWSAHWPAPAWVALALILILGVGVVLLYARQSPGGRMARAGLATLRIAALLLLVGMIAQFGLALQRVGPAPLSLVLDDSQSMTTIDRYPAAWSDALHAKLAAARLPTAEPTRWDCARGVLDEAFLGRLSQGRRIAPSLVSGRAAPEFAAKGAQAAPAAWAAALGVEAASAPSTPLGEAIRAALDAQAAPPTAIVLLSDGIGNAGLSLAEGAELARQRGVPIFTVLAGSELAQPNVRISDLLADHAVFVDDVATLDFSLEATGLPGQSVTVILHEAGQPQAVAEISVPIEGESVRKPLRLLYRPRKAGVVDLVIEAAPHAEERDPSDNRLTHRIEVRDATINVLLAAGRPTYEYRFLRDFLVRERSIALATYLFDADADFVRQEPGALAIFPVGLEALRRYDVVILDDLDPHQLAPNAAENLAAFVDGPQGGGALVLIAGPRAIPASLTGTALERVLPLSLGAAGAVATAVGDGPPFHVAPTELALSLPGFQLGDTLAETQRIWTSLPTLDWLAPAGRLRAGARVLAVAPERLGASGRPQPVFLMQYVGAGRVVYHATDETWRWRFRAEDRWFGRYWLQTLRWLARGKLSQAGRSVVLSADRRDYAPGEPVRLQLSFLDARLAPGEGSPPTVAVAREGEPPQLTTLTRVPRWGETFEAVLPHVEPGRYRARWVPPSPDAPEATVEFRVGQASDELTQLAVDRAALEAAADRTGGRFFTLAEADSLLRELPTGGPTPIETLPGLPLWRQWPIVLLLFALLTLEWTLRRWIGLP